MARIRLACFGLLALVLGCEQKPIDIIPESTGMEWSTVTSFQDRSGGYGGAEIWASGPGDVWVWARNVTPRLQHYDGAVWTPVSYSDRDYFYLREIWGSGPADVYVADSEIWHYDGAWTNTGIPGPFLAGSSSSNVLAGTPQVVMQFDGAAWDTLFTRPEPRGASRIAAYGASGAFITTGDSLLRWNGTMWDGWKAPGSVLHLLAFNENSVVAAGVEYPSYSVQRVWEFDGTAWTVLSDAPAYIYDVDLWGTSPSDLWMSEGGGTLYHYAGSAWETLTTPTHGDLTSVWGTGAGDAYSASSTGAVIRTQAGVSTAIRSSIPTEANTLWVASPTDFLLGGDRGTIHRFASGQWEEAVLPGDNSFVTAIAGSSLDLYAGTSAGRIYHFDGNDWTLFADSLLAGHFEVHDLSVPNDGSVYAAGYQAVALFDGGNWKIHEASRRFIAVWAHSRDSAFAMDYEGVFEWDGNAWHTSRGRGRGIYMAIWGSSPRDVYLADNYWIYHYDGNAWANVFPGSVDRITGTGPDDVIAISDFGQAHFDGLLWRWDGFRNCGCDPIDLTTAGSGDVFRLYRQYLGNSGTNYVVSRRVR